MIGNWRLNSSSRFVVDRSEERGGQVGILRDVGVDHVFGIGIFSETDTEYYAAAL